MRHMIQSYVHAFLDLIYPPYTHCVICLEAWPETDGYVCKKCLDALPWLGDDVCVCCGAPLKEERYSYCEQCESDVHQFNQARASFRYEEGVAQLIWRLKYSSETTLAPILGEWMNDTLNQTGWEFDVIVPVPLHPKRQRQRGYNQAGLLADEVGKWQATKVLRNGLVRNKSTQTQITLNRKQRLKNLSDVFTVVDQHLVSGKSILLIDDVYTTGATADQCSKVLYEAGAENVDVLTVAHTESQRKNKKHKI